MIDDATTTRASGGAWGRWGLGFVCAAGSAWIYHALTRVMAKMPPAEPTAAGEVFPWVKLLTRHSILSIKHQMHGFGHLYAFMGLCAGLFMFYAVILRLARGIQSRWFLAFAIGSAAVFMGILLCAPVMLSNDVYSYAHYGRLLAIYGVDAHAASAAANLPDPFSIGGHLEFVPSVYGPLWTIISAGLVQAGGGHIGLTVLLFRGLEAVAALGSGALIWLILQRLAPEHAAQGTLLFLWNPLVVIESALSGHNDSCMMALALFAVWLHVRGFKTGAVVALVLSALIKVVTWPLVPLYLLMTLRSSGGWRERAWFLGRAGIGAAAAVAVSMFFARMNPHDVTAHTAGSAQFYLNNYHEPLFKSLRHFLGEPAGTLEAPMDFQASWVTPGERAALHADITKKSKYLGPLRPGQPLLVLSRKDSDEWVRVYDPGDRLMGFVEKTHPLAQIAAPPNAQSDRVVRMLSVSPQDWPTVAKANRWIRLTTWGLFAAFGLLAAWKATNFDRFLLWATAFFLAAQLLVFSKIWPWYVIWPLAFGALKPRSPATRLAIMLSAGFAALYALLDYCNSKYEWLYDYRSMLAIVLPVALFAVLEGLRPFASRATARSVPGQAPTL